MMSSKGQVYAIKIVDFISKTEGPLYFEQVGITLVNFWFQATGHSFSPRNVIIIYKYMANI